MSILSSVLGLFWKKEPAPELRIDDADLDTPIEPSAEVTPEDKHRLLEEAEVSFKRQLQQIKIILAQSFVRGNDAFVITKVIAQLRPKIISLKAEAVFLKGVASRTLREDLRQELNRNWPLVYAAAARMMDYLNATRAGELTLSQLSEHLLREAKEIEHLAGW